MSALGDASIHGPLFKGSPIVIHTTARLAGAIGSLTWNGVEFIDATDHGREMQTAVVYDDQAEADNPTEAGSRADGVGPTSTSKLLTIKASGNVLKTSTQMAYWNPVDTVRLSQTKMNKRVTIGALGLANLIDYDVTVHVPKPRLSIVAEMLTGYLPPTFPMFYTLDLATGTLTAVTADDYTEGPLPVIVATADGHHAMGAYGFAASGYLRYGNAYMSKWSVLYGYQPCGAGAYSASMFVAVGIIADVQAALIAASVLVL